MSLTRDDIRAIYDLPFPELIRRAMEVHRAHHDPLQVQLCQLENIKSGRCPEDCAYCAQSAHHDVEIEEYGLEQVEEVHDAARRARESGATRLCMGAAWRGPRNRKEFETVLEMVRRVRGEGLEACVTLGMLTSEQAQELAEAGLTAYNHNLDTSPEHYAKIIHTHTFEDRLETIGHVRAAGISLCCGGIVGMGETREDRIGLLHALVSLDPPPESVPINRLVPIPGTPLADAEPLDPIELVRCIATARILMPLSRVRLSAGRQGMTRELQALCFVAGANSIFTGDRLLTTPNPGEGDQGLLASLGLRGETEQEAAEERARLGMR
ncbi:biotin synthase BioB [Candidatus Sumerlaeota bacterium]|nr:biotin synthase BioB [Candidatus Sumerlaeota bacterium]